MIIHHWTAINMTTMVYSYQQFRATRVSIKDTRVSLTWPHRGRDPFPEWCAAGASRGLSTPSDRLGGPIMGGPWACPGPPSWGVVELAREGEAVRTA